MEYEVTGGAHRENGRKQRRYDWCEPLTNPTNDEESAMSICPHPCPSDPTGPPDRCLGRTGPVKVDSGQKQVTGTRCSGGGEVRSCSEGSAVEPGEGHMGNVG